jgi:hypothetical protein
MIPVTRPPLQCNKLETYGWQFIFISSSSCIYIFRASCRIEYELLKAILAIYIFLNITTPAYGIRSVAQAHSWNWASEGSLSSEERWKVFAIQDKAS